MTTTIASPVTAPNSTPISPSASGSLMVAIISIPIGSTSSADKRRYVLLDGGGHEGDALHRAGDLQSLPVGGIERDAGRQTGRRARAPAPDLVPPVRRIAHAD